MNTNTTQKEYDIGYESGLNSIDRLFLETISRPNIAENDKKIPSQNIWAGLLTAILSALYVTAPNKLAADEIVKFAKESAIDARKESRKK